MRQVQDEQQCMVALPEVGSLVCEDGAEFGGAQCVLRSRADHDRAAARGQGVGHGHRVVEYEDVRVPGVLAGDEAQHLPVAAAVPQGPDQARHPAGQPRPARRQ